MRGKRIVCIGDMHALETAIRNSVVYDPDTADVILINGEGIIKQGTGDIDPEIQRFKKNTLHRSFSSWSCQTESDRALVPFWNLPEDR